MMKPEKLGILLIIHPDSNNSGVINIIMIKKIILLFSLLILIAGCQPQIPKDALIFSPQTLQERQLQTRRFDTNDEAAILSACAGLLQDLGFNLEESEIKVGVIVGSKDRSAVDAAQIVGSIFLALLTGVAMPTDTNQKMRACVVTRPVGENQESITVRVTFQRIVWNSQGQVSKREGLKDPKYYQEFFSKLSKAVFLEAHEI